MTGLEISEEKKKEIIQKFKEYYLDFGLSIYIHTVEDDTIYCEVSQRSDAKETSSKAILASKISELFLNTGYTLKIEWQE
jgi:hypothetical protein